MHATVAYAVRVVLRCPALVVGLLPRSAERCVLGLSAFGDCVSPQDETSCYFSLALRLVKQLKACRLVDHEGGVPNAVALVKQAANIPRTQQVRPPCPFHVCCKCSYIASSRWNLR